MLPRRTVTSLTFVLVASKSSCFKAEFKAKGFPVHRTGHSSGTSREAVHLEMPAETLRCHGGAASSLCQIRISLLPFLFGWKDY